MMKFLASVLFLVGLASAQFLSLPNAYPDSSTPGDSGLFIFQKNPYSLGKVKSIRGDQLKVFFRHDVVDTGAFDCDSLSVANGLGITRTRPTNCIIRIDSTARQALGTVEVKRQFRADSSAVVVGTATAAALIATGGSVPASANKVVINYVAGSTETQTIYGPDNSTPGAYQLVSLSANGSAGDIRLSMTSAGKFSIGSGGADMGATLGVNGNAIVRALSGNTDVRIWRGSGTDYGLGLTADNSAGDVYITSMGDNAGPAMRFRMRGLGTPIDAMDIAGSGNVTANYGVILSALSHSAGQDSLLAVTTTGRVHTMPTPAGGGADSAYADTAWLHLNWIPTVDSIFTPQDSNIFVVQRGGGGRKGNLTFGKIKTATAIYADGYYPAGPDSIDIDTNANYLNYHIMELHNGSGGQSVRLPDPSGLPDGWLFTILDFDAIPGTVTIYSKGTPIFYPTGNSTEVIPETMAAVLNCYSKTFVAHAGNWTVAQTGVYSP